MKEQAVDAMLFAADDEFLPFVESFLDTARKSNNSERA